MSIGILLCNYQLRCHALTYLAPPPSGTIAAVIMGSAIQGKTLAEEHGSWSNFPTSYSYQWEECDTSGNSCHPIVGAASQFYKLPPMNVNHTIRVQESAASETGEGDPETSAPSSVVRSTRPAKVKIINHRALLRGHRFIDLRIRCSAEPEAGCRGRISLIPLVRRNAFPRLYGGRSKFTIKAGSRRSISITLTPFALSQLRKRRRLLARVNILIDEASSQQMISLLQRPARWHGA